MSEHQRYIDAYNQWQEEYKPGEFIEFSDWAYKELLATTDIHYVWTHHGTCENERYSNGIRSFSTNGCGCWQTFGWVVCEKPWDGTEDTFLVVDTEWSGPCEKCNPDGNDDKINEDCPECDGEGYTQDYFD